MSKQTELQKKLTALIPDVSMRFYEPMAKHTSFRIGGPAEVMVFPKNAQELADVIRVSNLLDSKIAILGAGTNVLAPDEGLCGIIICLKDSMDGMQLLEGNRICVAAGVTMTRAAIFAASNGLSGLEFAHGIPGTVGGGAYMNAGAYGGEICQVCESVEIMRENGDVVTLTADQMEFSYRHSRMEGTKDIILSVTFLLQPKPETEIRAVMQELMRKRSNSQPLDLPSAGSAFKRPVGGYAAALIDEAGLKGFRVGDAAISEKHAGFAVNLGKATAADVQELLKEVSYKVFENSGIKLEPEVRIW